MGLIISESPIIPRNLRECRLKSLGKAQEFFLENLVGQGKVLLLSHGNHTVGYAVFKASTLVEFYLQPQFGCWLESGIRQVVRRSNVTKALGQTFDPLFLAAALSIPGSVKPVASLFRDIVDSSFEENSSVEATPASEHDLETIAEIHDGFFADRQEMMSYIVDRGLFIYRKSGKPVGCGIRKKIVPSGNDFDIGMVVAPEFRLQGWGTYIIAHLKNDCLRSGFNPVCGCSDENLASKRALEKAGFVSLYRMIEVKWAT